MFGSGDNSFVVKLRGLPFSTTIEDVLDFLDGVKVLNGKEGVHLTEVRPGRPSGECFVEVESQDDVDEALKKDKQNMGKRYIEVFSTDRQDMEWALNAMQQNPSGPDNLPNVSDHQGVVKLRGLPFGCTKEEVVKFFSGLHLGVEGVHLLSDVSGRPSGEAFVHFEDKDSAERALEKDREKIGHRYIEIFMSSAEEVRSWGHGGGGGGGRGPGGRGYGRPAPYDRNDRFGGRYQRGGRGGGLGGGRGGGGLGSGYSTARGGGGGGLGGGLGGGRGRGPGRGHCIHMRGLPFKATEQDVAFFFKPIRPLHIDILYDASDRPSGEADVEFECHEDAMRAMRRDKNNMDNRYIELFLNSCPPGPQLGGFKPPQRPYRN